MCARYSLGKIMGMERYLLIDKFFLPERQTNRYAVAPGTQVPTIDLVDGEFAMVERKWGLKPAWWKMPPVINARSSTALEKPLFRNLVPRQRCLMPVAGYYEWSDFPDGKQPFYFRRPDQMAFMFAAILGDSPEGPQCALLTTEPNSQIAAMHDRMPSILDPEQARIWLETPSADEAIQVAMAGVPDGYLEMYPVTRRVNSSSYDAPDAILRITEREPNRDGQFSLF
jgi:hypothetical protein